jgi:predicted TIM-barrel fold metal-dependent hydrolase
MRPAVTFLIAIAVATVSGCARQTATARSGEATADPALRSFIDGIRAIDNHTHVNSLAPNDADYDALPLDGIPAFDLPVLLRADNPEFAAAQKALYPTPGAKTSHANDLPAWALDQIGTEIMLANRIAMGPGLEAPRFRWVSYVDALMLPLSTQSAAAATPDRQKLFPLEDALLRRYLADRHMTAVPPTLDAYVKTVVTPTMEDQKRGGCVAVKFEAAYLRALDFEPASADAASAIYARFARGGVPSPAEYKVLQDFLFRFIAREAGRLGMAVHIHSFEGVGNYFDIAGADPLKLQSALDDPALHGTTFVIIHGGGMYSSHTGALLWRSNVFADMSLMTLAYAPARLAAVLEPWLSEFPEKVLFGSDASGLSADMGWEIAAFVGTRHAREALAIALTNLMRQGMTRDRAQDIATMVLRGNAKKLYKF